MSTSALQLTLGGSRTYGNSCGSCGSNVAYNNGKNAGHAVAGLIGNKLQHIAGFFDGLSGAFHLHFI